jgi:hypothetical protein
MERAEECRNYISDTVWRLLTRPAIHTTSMGEPGNCSTYPAMCAQSSWSERSTSRWSYDTSIFADQHFHFHDSLRTADRVAVIGYGFADKGINTRLIGWLLDSRDRRLVVVHGDEDKLVEGAIKHKWQGWPKEGRLRVVPRWVADVGWEDIAAASA